MNIEWRDQLSVGNDLIDYDDKSLIEIINQAGKTLKQKNLAALTEALDSLHASHGSLLERLINHVIKEDMLMKPMLKKFSPRFDPR